MPNYSYEIVGARGVGLQYYNARVIAKDSLEALRCAARVGKEKFSELYRISIKIGGIVHGITVAEFLSQVAAQKRSTIEDMPELKTAGPKGLVRVRKPENQTWKVAKGLEDLL